MGDFYMPLIKRPPVTIFENHTFEIISFTLSLFYFWFIHPIWKSYLTAQNKHQTLQVFI